MYTNFTSGDSVSFDYGHGQGGGTGGSTTTGTEQENFTGDEVSKAPAAAVEKVKTETPKLLRDGPTFPDEFFCHVCDAKCTSDVVYQQHLKGARHKKVQSDTCYQVIECSSITKCLLF
uniref:Uncharacterized protein LOC102809588 n=1 Tax=Saccoglossus kowalevskii TaxID=10224 RepID=A0ABM0MXB7_SACKO|nr:PREDICTED: uncharacterized protein LOC102809588 [Saccoglossus kowalevskii]